MSWQHLLDAYEWKARWIPTVLVLLPALTTLYYCFPQVFSNVIFVAGSGFVTVAIVYLIAMLLRDLGLQRQPVIWASWGGPPSTRFARHFDSRFSDAHKLRIRNAARRRFGIVLAAKEEEALNQEAADRLIEQAFRAVREFLRQKDSVGLVAKQNAEYGFARHVYAGREAALILSIVGFAICGFVRPSDGVWAYNIGSQVNLLYFALWIVLGWLIAPGMLKRAAETYAERAWMTFLEIEGNS
jgi:hypothetical protein